MEKNERIKRIDGVSNEEELKKVKKGITHLER